MRLVTDERDDHAVEVEEEHDQVVTELDERFLRNVRGLASSVGGSVQSYLLVNIELSEDLGRVKEVLVLEDPECG